MCQGSFRLDIKKIFFNRRIVKHWNILSREVIESLLLEVFKRHVDVMIRDMVLWDLAVLELWLDSMVSNVFFQLNDLNDL